MDEKRDIDPESGKPTPIPYFKQVFDQGVVTPAIINWQYEGEGTEDDPFIVTWIDDDPRNPMNYPGIKKWMLVLLVAFATLAVAFVSSAYSGGVAEIIRQFDTSDEVATLGISLFVLGFAIGPLLWAPLSELFGRQKLFIGTYAMLTFFNAGACGSQNIWTLVILRFFGGAFGSSPLTNAGGVIADMFNASQRGVAMVLFASAPFMGPVLGPVVGGFVGETIGWRWLEGIMAIFTGLLWIIGWLFLPETYPPVLLRQRANRLSKITGKVYRSKTDAEQGTVTIGHAFATALSRPWILLFREPIVFLLSIYMAIIYGTLYMMFGAFPIVYQQERHWSQGIGGLAFFGVAVGMMFAMVYAFLDNKRYIRAAESDPSGFAPPEARLPPTMVGAVAIPIGLFWFAWTNSPSLPWAASVCAGIPFGFGMVLVFLSIMNYLIDAYVIFAASVLAANSVLRSIFGATFPLFTTYMYSRLGIHWASSIPAFLALICVPFPFIFYKYGAGIRKRCKFAAEADEFMQKMRQQGPEGKGQTSSDESTDGTQCEHAKEVEEDKEQEAFDYSYEDEMKRNSVHDGTSGFERIKTGTSVKQQRSRNYDSNPFDLDRVNTSDSFSIKGRSRAGSRVNSRSVSRINSRGASSVNSANSRGK